jgi:hypothetical protein
MINRERYSSLLSKLLNDYYKEIKRTGSASKESKEYIDGYLTAARALNIFQYEELKDIVEKIHLKAFGKSIRERRLSELSDSSPDDEFLEIPTYIREGMFLNKK